MKYLRLSLDLSSAKTRLPILVPTGYGLLEEAHHAKVQPLKLQIADASPNFSYFTSQLRRGTSPLSMRSACLVCMIPKTICVVLTTASGTTKRYGGLSRAGIPTRDASQCQQTNQVTGSSIPKLRAASRRSRNNRTKYTLESCSII